MIKMVFWLAVIMEFISLLCLIFKERFVSIIKTVNLLLKGKEKDYDIYKLSLKISNIFFTVGFILIVGIILKNFIS